ncbi:MAG: DUF2335 domain-containing protein [Candidatus Dojkabacteria bacterium]
MSKSKNRKIVSRQSSDSAILHAQFHEGPIPDPSTLEGYESVVPGSADRILSMAEAEQDHRHRQEDTYLRKNIRNETLGMVFAFSLALILILTGCFLLYAGRDAEGLVIALVPAIGYIVQILTVGVRSKKK